jgi:putative membrane protein
MGAADVIPGVSGGTIALITGIYEKLIRSISNINPSLFFKGQFKDFFKRINFKFFIPLISGIAIAIYFLSGVITSLLLTFPNQLYSFFIGLILASIIYLYRQSKDFKFESFISLLAGLIVAYFISGSSILAINHSLPVIFASGVLAICAMILPGISGAFILLLLNQYEYIISAVHERNITIVLTFGLGAVIGILLFSKLLKRILHRYKNLTISFLIGLMLGSLRVPLSRVTFADNSWIFLWMVVGFVLVLLLEIPFKKSHIP